IAKALKVPVCSLIKHYSLELRTQSKWDMQLMQLKGTFDYETLLKILRKFNRNYVICPQCDLPEFEYVVKNKKMKRKCCSCGFRELCDMTDKIFQNIHTYYSENPSQKSMKTETKYQVTQENELMGIGNAEFEVTGFNETVEVDVD